MKQLQQKGNTGVIQTSSSDEKPADQQIIVPGESNQENATWRPELKLKRMSYWECRK